MSEQQTETTERKARTVSTAYLEKIRNHKQVSVGRFLQDILEYHNENPSDTFQETITNYSKENKIKGSSGKSSGKDPNKARLKYIFDNNLSPIKGSYINSSVSRRKDHQDGEFYTVNLMQDTGVKSKIYANMTDPNNIMLEVNGIPFGPISIEQNTENTSDNDEDLDDEDDAILRGSNESNTINVEDNVESSPEEEEDEVYQPHLG